MGTTLDSFYPMTGVTEQLAQWQTFAPYYQGDGIVAETLNSFNVTQHTPAGMSVDVQSGYCFISGVFGANGSFKQMTIAAANATNPRIDRVVLRLDTVANDIEIVVITGTAAVSPSAPALVRSATQTDYSLFQVLVGTTVTSIVTANLTDERQFASPRGIPFGRTIVSSGTIQPFGPLPLTEPSVWLLVSGTTTIANVATGNLPPRSGSVLILNFQSGGCTVNATGNIDLKRPYISGAIDAILTLMWNGTLWVEIARSGEQAPAHQYYGNPTGTVAGATFASIVAADLPAFTTWVPSAAQSGALTFTTLYARTTQFGKLAMITASLVFTNTGTITNNIVVTLPAGLTIAALLPGGGSFLYNDISAALYAGWVQITSTTTLVFYCHNNASPLGTTPNIAVAVGDSLTFMICVELG